MTYDTSEIYSQICYKMPRPPLPGPNSLIGWRESHDLGLLLQAQILWLGKRSSQKEAWGQSDAEEEEEAVTFDSNGTSEYSDVQKN